MNFFEKPFDDELLYVVDGELLNHMVKLLGALDIIDEKDTNKQKVLKVGNINSKRDFSWAPEIMKGVFYASNLKPQDIVFGTGKEFFVKDMIKFFLKIKKMNFNKFIKIDKSLYRKKEKKNISISTQHTKLLLKKWKWKPSIYGDKLVKKLYYSN